MKRLVFAFLAFFALSNFAFASNINFATISKTDTQFLFKDKSVKVVALNENELKKTQGAFLPIFITLVSCVANAPAPSERLYHGTFKVSSGINLGSGKK
ncbi:hypothetical protein [Caminibacter pacificus]